MHHGSETWPMKVEHELKMSRTEMSMIRWMCVEYYAMCLGFMFAYNACFIVTLDGVHYRDCNNE